MVGSQALVVWFLGFGLRPLVDETSRSKDPRTKAQKPFDYELLTDSVTSAVLQETSALPDRYSDSTNRSLVYDAPSAFVDSARSQ